MSGSDRSKHTKAGLITGFICAALMVAVFIGWGLLESTKYQREADYQASEHAKYTSDKVAQTCVGIAPAKRFECVGNAIAAQRDTERNEQDLVAQRQSALWAYIMGAAAVIGMGLSAIGVFLVWTTFRETRRTVEISEKTYQAFISLERPKLVVHMGEVLVDSVGNFVFDISVTNIGKTACVVTRNLSRWRKTADFNEVSGYLGNPIHVLVEAEKTVEIARVLERRDTIVGTSFFGGLITYQSPLAERHRTFFCYQLIPTDSHNDCDIKRRSIKGADWPKDD